MLFYIALALGIAASAVFIIKRDANSGKIEIILKAVSSMLFVLTAAAGIYYSPEKNLIYGLLITAGLVFGLVGDIWLDLGCMYPKDRKAYMYAGFVFFIIGHTFYSSAVIIKNQMSVGDILFCLIAPPVAAACTAVMGKLFKLDMSGYRFVSILYGAFMMMTVSVSNLMAVRYGGADRILMLAGAILFLLSDFVLSGTYFGKGKDTKPYIVLNHALYYIAQYMIASTVFLSK